QRYLMYLSAALVGACLGFMPYNFRPGRAQIFLGDGGATFIGFTLAGLAVMGEWAEGDPIIALLTPSLILGVPLFDIGYVGVARPARRRAPARRSAVAAGTRPGGRGLHQLHALLRSADAPVARGGDGLPSEQGGDGGGRLAQPAVVRSVRVRPRPAHRRPDGARPSGPGRRGGRRALANVVEPLRNQRDPPAPGRVHGAPDRLGGRRGRRRRHTLSGG